MKTLGVTQWSDIKVGEVFAAEQYKIPHGTVYSILIKLKNRGVIYVDNDYCATDRYNQAQRYTFKKKYIPKDYDNLIFYKLPVAVQRNWIGYGR